MLALVETRNAKIDAQRRLTTCLQRAWGNRETRVVVWRPDRREMPVTHNGRYWFGSLDPDQGERTPKYWNPFGRYHERGNLQIGVEINIPTESNSRTVAGFFAKDIETDMVYLMHDGGVGGGRQGVGRDPFLAWSDAKPEPVIDAHGELRPGIVVAPVDFRTTAGDIARFIQLVLDFKQAVLDGEGQRRTTKAQNRDQFRGTVSSSPSRSSGESRERSPVRRCSRVAFVGSGRDQLSAMIGLRKTPIPSPGFVQRGGFCTKPTPSGLPVGFTSPGFERCPPFARKPQGGVVFLTRLKGQCHFCDAAGDVETLATFDAERLQRN